MGGKGSGHKSVKALLSRQANIQKARAARRRPPLPWRSGMESRVIEQLVWQWFQSSDKWLVASGERRQEQVPHQHPAPSCSNAAVAADRAGWVRDDMLKGGEQAKQREKQVPHTVGMRPVRNDNLGVAGGREKQMQIPRRYAPRNDSDLREGSARIEARGAESGYAKEGGARTTANVQLGTPQIIARAKERPWSAVRVARLLGVSHTWVNKLVKKFEADPERMRRKMRAFAPANLEKLEAAREETRREREMGRLRGPIRWRRVNVTIQGKKMKMASPTKEEMRRRASRAAVSGERLVANKQKHQQVPHTAERRSVRNDSAFLAYRELPSWAKGLMLAGDAGAGMRGAGSSMQMPPVKTRTPRPVPFAFRRRR